MIGEFYSIETAENLKKKISNELRGFKADRLSIKVVEKNKIRLISGSYNSINLLKNDYMLLKNFGFEELDIVKNEETFYSFYTCTKHNSKSRSSPKISAKTAILYDYDSDKILYEMDPDLTIYPASMTKIMTTIIAFDLLKQNKLSLDDKFIVSEKAWRLSQSGYSSMFIMINDEVSVDDLLKGIIVASGNDACVALAEGIAGTEENFVDIMNEKAAEIGMSDTNFSNSSGINDTENYSTVRDIAIMSKYLIKNYPEYYPLYAETEFTWDRTGGDPITQSNRNNLLFKRLGVDGIKTGYLAVEKYSLASSMKKDTQD